MCVCEFRCPVTSYIGQEKKSLYPVRDATVREKSSLEPDEL